MNDDLLQQFSMALAWYLRCQRFIELVKLHAGALNLAARSLFIPAVVCAMKATDVTEPALLCTFTTDRLNALAFDLASGLLRHFSDTTTASTPYSFELTA